MGKTKTAMLGEMPAEEKSGKEAYEEKRRKKEEAQKKAQLQGLGLKGGERIQVISGESLPDEALSQDQEKGGEISHKEKYQKVRGKKYQEAYKKIDKLRRYSSSEAIKLAKETSYSKFDASIDLHLIVKKENLSVEVNLPFFSGKKRRVELTSEETIENLKSGKINFDVLLATADMMPKLLPFAKLLGPRGLMPNPKTGTLIKDKKEVDKFSGNTLSVKTEKKQPIIHVSIGKVSQKENELLENLNVIIDAVNKKLINKAYLASSMGPSIKLEL